MDYKETLLLPKTDFPMRGNLPKNEPLRYKKWFGEGAYGRMKANREGMTAGLVMAGLEASCPGTLGTAIAKVFDLGIARTGLTLEEAAAFLRTSKDKV